VTGLAQGSPDYFGLVDQVTSMVTAVVPPSKTVLVVSKGDENLLRLGSRTGWHFPRTDDGRYAGHYPADSDDAIRQLEALRERGAGYVVFPATSLWWLDHYPELGRHLGRYTCLVRDEDTCAIFDLTQAPAESAAPGNGAVTPATAAAAAAAATPPDRRTVQLTAFLDNLLPARASVRIASSGEDLESLEAAAVEFLVIPRGSRLAHESPELLDELDRRHRCVARQRYLCTVYDLTLAHAAERETPGGSRQPGAWQRFLRLFRRGRGPAES
jgi:hypothetical protein